MQPYFSDERLWSQHRRRWKLKQWWARTWPLLAAGALIAAWGYATWSDERDRRVEAETNLHHIAMHITKPTCGASLIIAGEDQEKMALALASAAGMADVVRGTWRVINNAKEKKKGT